VKLYFRACEKQTAISYVDRWQNKTKTEILKKAWASLLPSVTEEDELILIQDHVSKETLEWMEKSVTKGLLRIVDVPEHTWEYHQHTVTLFDTLYKECENGNDDDFHLLIEDDYLWVPNGLNVIREAVKYWHKGFLVPYDYPDRYIKPAACAVYLGPDRHWRTINSCTMTIGAKSLFWKHFKESFYEAAPTSNDKVFETIVMNYNVPILSPIPALASHLTNHHASPYIDVVGLWNQTKVD